MAVYFELYGLPGAGKTTLCRPVISKLKQIGYDVADLDDIYSRNCKKRGKISILLKMLIMVRLYPLYYKLWRVYMSCDSSDRNLSYFFKALFLSYQILDAYKRGGFDAIFCEEGFIQYISSFCYSDVMPNSCSLNNLCTYISSLLKVQLIHCDIGVEDSFTRIKERPVVSKRFSSSYSSDLLKKALISKQTNLATISSHFSKVLNLDMLKDITDNNKILFDFVSQKLNQFNYGER